MDIIASHEKPSPQQCASNVIYNNLIFQFGTINKEFGIKY